MYFNYTVCLFSDITQYTVTSVAVMNVPQNLSALNLFANACVICHIPSQVLESFPTVQTVLNV